MSPHTIEVFNQKPKNFHPKVEIAACYVEVENDLLLLQIQPNKKEAGAWGVPAGKVEPDETPENGAIRELFEETGISVSHSQLHPLGHLYMRKPEIEYIYHMYRVHFNETPSVLLSSEHQSFKWASRDELKHLRLMAGAKEALEKYLASLNAC